MLWFRFDTVSFQWVATISKPASRQIITTLSPIVEDILNDGYAGQDIWVAVAPGAFRAAVPCHPTIFCHESLNYYGIEHAIELVKALDDPRCKLVISHEDGDEGCGYSEWVQSMARNRGVDLRLVTQNVISPWGEPADLNGRFSLWAVYAAADLVTFCSFYEGFGNGLLEAVYFKKPVVINRYGIYVNDIEPLGFDFITLDGYLSHDVIRAARDVLNGNGDVATTVRRNYEISRNPFLLRGPGPSPPGDPE